MTRLVFDFPDADGMVHRTVLANPVQVLAADRLDDVPAVVEAVEAAAARGLHAAGYLAYEAAPAFDPAMRVRGGGRMPLAWFGLFEAPADPDVEALPLGAAGAGEDAAYTEAQWRAEDGRREHAAAVARIREAIAEGRTYQVNLATRLRTQLHLDPWQLYLRMRRAQGAGYHAYLDMGRQVVVSASPELFFRMDGREITTRPMKGTRPRGRWAEEDAVRRRELEGSEKDRAENLMIVDLLRNDLGRVCRTGSVRTSRLLEVERYRTVWQLTSTVTGRLRGTAGLSQVLAALFPCGSVTGAPKISTMGLIAELERSPREVYCGAIGWIRPGGDCTFSVPIRTAWLDRVTRAATYGTGGGIVWDSRPDEEYRERVAKAVVVREPWPEFSLLETMALVDGHFTRLERHIARMRASAEYFDFPFPETRIRVALDDLVKERPTGSHRARITVDRHGAVRAEALPLQEPRDGPLPVVAVSRTPVDSTNRFLFHKTTYRRVYERRRAEASSSLHDVLLLNERGEITEFTRGNVVLDLDGRLVTPARSSGLLAGCLRAELLEDAVVREEQVPVSALWRARRVWFINSARGWIEVRVERSGDPESNSSGSGHGPSTYGR